jgi:hypothetical protein
VWGFYELTICIFNDIVLDMQTVLTPLASPATPSAKPAVLGQEQRITASGLAVISGVKPLETRISAVDGMRLADNFMEKQRKQRARQRFARRAQRA